MDRNIYKYNIGVVGIDVPNKPERIEFNIEFKNVLDYLMNLPKEERRKEFLKNEKVVYLEECQKLEEENNINIYYLKFVSLKYNQTREVLNKDTLESKGRLKDINDGDKEYNHVVIIECDRKIKAAFEYNYYGLQSLGMIISYLNDMCSIYFNNLGIDKYYFLEAHNEVNREFIEELNRMTKINAATIVVDSDRLGNTDFGNLSGREEVKNEIEVTLKKARKSNIPKDIIQNYYNNKMIDNGIKRIYVSGRNSISKVKLDTEEMKQKEKISVPENAFGEIDSNIMFEELKKYLMEE